MKSYPGMIKKNRYKFKKYTAINANQLCIQFKGNIQSVQQFHYPHPHPLLFSNSPICLTAKNYIGGMDVLKFCLNEPFVQQQMYIYRLTTEEFQQRMLRRLIKVIESIKKYGYCKGRYRYSVIGVIKGVDDYFGLIDGFSLISGKHRAAAAIALGYRELKVGLWIDCRKKKG